MFVSDAGGRGDEPVITNPKPIKRLMKIFDRRSFCSRGGISAAATLLLLLYGVHIFAATAGTKGIQSNGGEDRCLQGCATGVVNGVTLKIPRNYLIHSVAYVGESRDGMGPASAAATERSIIDNFGILLKTSTLQPITTAADKVEWRQAFEKPLFSKTWMLVSFDNHYPVPKDASHDRPAMIEEWGPYDQDKASPFGLKHFDSIQPVDRGNRGFHAHVEYFYDHDSLTTIVCQTYRKKVEPYDTFDICEHHFFIPELNLMADAIYTKSDLPRWAEIAKRVKEIAHTFIVK
jgi:hypothetical protein